MECVCLLLKKYESEREGRKVCHYLMLLILFVCIYFYGLCLEKSGIIIFVVDFVCMDLYVWFVCLCLEKLEAYFHKGM